MCYFDDVPLVSNRKIPRSRAVQAWKGFDRCDTGFVSPWREVIWVVDMPNEATEHGFYAVVKRPKPETPAAGRGKIVKRVLLWGRVREYKGKNDWGDHCHGYRAQYCMIMGEAPRRAAQKKARRA